MKKYSLLFFSTLALLLIIYLGGNLIKGQIEEVETVVLSANDVQNKITCSGQLEPSESKKVYVTAPSVAQEVYVSVGDRVEVGENLLQVRDGVSDKSDTPEDLQDNVSSFSLSDLSGLSYEEAADVYQQYINGTSSSESSSSSTEGDEKSTGTSSMITAPVSGIVSEINVKTNEKADAKQPVMVISEDNSMQVRLSVNESQISSVQLGQKVRITGVGFQNSEYSGTVKSIANVAKQSVSTVGQETVVEVIVSVDHAGEDLKSGLTAKCEITTSSNSGVLLAPYEAVRAEENGQEYVYVYQDGKAVKTPITTGKEFAQGFEVLSGLSEGDQVITTPDRLRPNQNVKVKEESVNDHV